LFTASEILNIPFYFEKIDTSMFYNELQSQIQLNRAAMKGLLVQKGTPELNKGAIVTKYARLRKL
jgi:hypothetical protein